MDDSRFVDAQYRTSDKLADRIQLYRFGKAAVSWHRWIYDLIDVRPDMRVLEIGCGNGELWSKNLDDLPISVEILLTDQSEGMISSVRERLGRDSRFRFQACAVEDLDLPPASFNIILANHMLYHVADIPTAIAKVSGLVAPDGTFIASTNGVAHLSELKSMLLELGEEYRFPREDPSFTLENGASFLSRKFQDVNRIDYTNDIDVPVVDPIVRFVRSIFDGTTYPSIVPRMDDFLEIVKRRLRDGNGVVRITSRTGMFACRRPD
jgi:ubiquinone/menaquinone biosynthesis C-methylase UbiE